MRRLRAVTVGIAGLMAGSLVFTACSSPAPEVPETPLNAYLAPIWDSADLDSETLDREFLEIEELVASCMTAAGFEYEPTPAPQVGYGAMGVDGTLESSDWGTLEFAETYGYGIVEQPTAGDESEKGFPEDPGADPNMVYVQSLTDSKRMEYYEALYGPSPTEEQLQEMQDSGASNWVPSDPGCYGTAEATVRGSGDGGSNRYWEDPLFAELMADIDALYVEIANSPAIDDLEQAWIECMAEAGHPRYASKLQARERLFREWNTLHEHARESGQEFLDDATLRAFQTLEIEIAVQDRLCAEDIGYDEEYQRVMFAAEEAFIEEHRERLDALIDQYGAPAAPEQ